MLGKRPCLLRTTSSRSLLIPGEDTEGDPTTYCNFEQVTEKKPCPALSAPCKVIIGFDVGTEKKDPSNACESPRSVLDTLALLPPQEKQHVVARSPRSGLGSLLTAKSGIGVGLEMVAQIQDKEVGVHVDSVVVSFKSAFHSQKRLHETYSDKMSLSLKSSHYRSKGTGWLGKASNSDFMDAESLSWQRQAPCVLCVEDERLDADISPRQSQAMFAPSSQEKNVSYAETYVSPYQSRALDACIDNGFKEGCLDADNCPQCSHAPWQVGFSHVIPRNVANNEYTKAQLPTWQSGAAWYGYGSKGAVDGCENDHIFKRQSEAWSLCEDECTDIHVIPRQRQASHQVSLDTKREEISIQQSIFFATSPPSCPHSLITSFSGFLKVCYFCGHSLRLGEDIFMYRGDQAFCSAECRYQKIVLDESKEKQAS